MESPTPGLTSADPTATVSGGAPSLRTLSLLFMAEALVLALFHLPHSLDFGAFVTADEGSELSVVGLLRRGMTPTIDFAYHYGLVPLVLSRGWFGLLGLTPRAYVGAMVVLNLLVAWGLARCVHALRAGAAGIALIVCTMIICVQTSYIHVAHGIETVLIAHALADHAVGRRSRALALLTACLFVKPAMAYVYGFLLVLLILRAGGLRGLVRAAWPSAAVGLVIGVTLAAWFGPRAVVNTLDPSGAAQCYRLWGYGFFRETGRKFWLPPGVTPRHYIFSPAGHYLIASLILIASGIASALRAARRPGGHDDFKAEVLACCGLMHLLFLTSFYGDFMSYTYYYYIFAIGLVAISTRGRAWAAVVALIAAAALVGNKDGVNWTIQGWREKRPGADTFGLWADPATREEWRRVQEIVDGRHGTYISGNVGCLELFEPRTFGHARGSCLAEGWPLPHELELKRRDVAEAEFVVVAPTAGATTGDGRPAPFREAMDGCELEFAGARFKVFLRRRPPSPPSGGSAPGKTS